MINILKNIIIFVISIITVSIASYLYVYKGFIDVIEKNKIQYKTNIIKEEIKENTTNIKNIFHDIIENNSNHNLSKILLQFLDFSNVENSNLYLNSYIKIPKSNIIQINNELNRNLLIEGTTTEIYLNFTPILQNKIKFNIYGNINDKPIILKGIYNKEEHIIILSYLKIDGFLTLYNNKGFDNYIKDGFTIKYGSIIGKKIDIKEIFNKKIIDLNIPERYVEETKNIIIGIEDFIKLKTDKELYFIFSEKLKNTSSEIKKYILNKKGIVIGKKQSLLLDLTELSKKLDNTEIEITKEKIEVKNTDSKFLFNFDFNIYKGKVSSLNEDINIDNSGTLYSIIEIEDLLLSKNKLLVKYLNGEDLLFLIGE